MAHNTLKAGELHPDELRDVEGIGLGLNKSEAEYQADDIIQQMR